MKYRLAAIARAIAPSREAWAGASVAVVLISLAMWLSATFDVVTAASVAAPLLVGSAGILIAIIGAGLLILALSIARRMPLHFRWVTLSGFVLLSASYALVPLVPSVLLASIVVTLAVASIAGGTTAVVLAGTWRQSGRLVRVVTAVLTLVGVGAAMAAFFWLAGAGAPRAEIPNAASPAIVSTPQLSISSPASKGSYTVKTTTYGAGSDAHRAEFAAEAPLRTRVVDGSKVLKGWKGFTGWARTKLWGFDAKSLPLNGRVWYPLGVGPFPLVLIVHGNHLSSDFSDLGYQYLGELLASRGYIFVSVDENFLNSMETNVVGGLDKENNARGWLLLEHLRVWHEWNADKTSPFFRKVDTERIALIGHSRGGEAVAHAAAFNRIAYNPDDAALRFDYGYRIRSIVAIAPADAQYRPAGVKTPLENVNYLTIQGSHDSDVSSFSGLNQLDRVKFTNGNDWFKAAVYAYGANHGQFNTIWGNLDVGVGIPKHFVNTRALLDAADQRRIAEVFISAFLDCTLGNVPEYRQLFQDCRCGSKWLPNTVYVTQYSDAGMKWLCTFDEDIDLSTATVASGKITSRNLTLWREGCIKFRSGENEDRAAFLGWDRDHHPGEPSYEITWPAKSFELDEGSVLSCCLADADLDPTPDDEEASAEREKSKDAAPRPPMDLTVEVVDAEGHVARLPLGHFRLLQPQIKTPYFKSTLLHGDPLSEPIFQTFLFALSDFRGANPDFNPTSTVRLRLIFDRTVHGVVIFDRAALGTLHK